MGAVEERDVRGWNYLSGIFPVGSCLGGRCPSVNCPSVSCSGGRWPSGSCPGGSCAAGNFPGGSFPGVSRPVTAVYIDRLIPNAATPLTE